MTETIRNLILNWISNALDLLETHTVDKVEKDLPSGKIQAYWAGTVIRIDYRPTQRS